MYFNYISTVKPLLLEAHIIQIPISLNFSKSSLDSLDRVYGTKDMTVEVI